MPAVMIEPAMDPDAEVLTALVHSADAYRGKYGSIIDGYQVTSDYIDRHRVFVARDANDRMLGFYALVLEPPELDLMFVADDAQGLGVGRSLVEHMLGQAKAAGLPEVPVVSHPPAERFYRRMGAEHVGTVPPSPPKITWERPKLRFRTG